MKLPTYHLLDTPRQKPKQQPVCTYCAGQRAQAHNTKEPDVEHPLATPQATQLDNNVVLEGWAAVGGHAAVIQQLKEMVLAPLQYPDMFKHMAITPPR